MVKSSESAFVAAQLLQQLMQIAEHPALRDAVGGDAKEGDAAIAHASARRGDVEQYAAMCAGVPQLRDDGVALGDEVLDVVVEVRKRRVDRAQVIPELVAAVTGRAERTAKTHVFCQKLVRQRDVPAVPHRFIIP